MNSKTDLNEKFISFLEQTKNQEKKSVTHLNDRVLIVDGLNTFIRSFAVNPALNVDGLHVGGAPQTQFSLGVSAAPMEGLIVHPVINYFANFYSDFDPADRGDESMKGVDSYMNDAAMTIDLHTTYSFTLIGYNMTLGLHAFNLTDTEYVNFAIDGGDGTKESARVFYGLGQRFNLSLGVNF